MLAVKKRIAITTVLLVALAGFCGVAASAIADDGDDAPDVVQPSEQITTIPVPSLEETELPPDLPNACPEGETCVAVEEPAPAAPPVDEAAGVQPSELTLAPSLRPDGFPADLPDICAEQECVFVEE